MMTDPRMTWSAFLPLLCLANIVLASSAAAHCPRPIVPQLVSAKNAKNAYPDLSSYTHTATELSLQCWYEVYILKEPVSIKCVDGNWTTPTYECVPKIYRKQKKTKTILIISGAVFGILAATFALGKVVCHVKSKHKPTECNERDEIEMRGHIKQCSVSSNVQHIAGNGSSIGARESERM